MTPANLKTWPKMIWLQAQEDEPFDNTYTSETNWCAEEVFSNDVLYVRHDLSGSAAEISALKEKLNEATTLLTDALGILESPVYRDSAGARPNIHPRVMDIRDFLENTDV